MIDHDNLTENQRTFVYWVDEREKIRERKDAGEPKPWTIDKIFQTYKFCNVERENDRVTIWIRENWREPYMGHPNLWFAMVVARLFNWPPTLELIGFPEGNFRHHIEDWREKLKKYREEGNKVFTGAYLVSTNGVSMDKIDYILDRVLTNIWLKGRGPNEGDLLQYYWKFLNGFDGIGSFMAGQIVADLKYTPLLDQASDWWTFAPLGPGSRRGLNRFYGRKLNQYVHQDAAQVVEFREIQALIEDKLGWLLPAHDIQNCCCEVDKYLRVKYGEGKPRSSYPGLKDE